MFFLTWKTTSKHAEKPLAITSPWYFGVGKTLIYYQRVVFGAEEMEQIRAGTLIAGVRVALVYPNGSQRTRSVFEGLLHPDRDYLNVVVNKREPIKSR